MVKLRSYPGIHRISWYHQNQKLNIWRWSTWQELTWAINWRRVPCQVTRVSAQSLYASPSSLGFVQMPPMRIYSVIPLQVQGPEHPSPGQPYTASNFPRAAYLPDTPDGCRFKDLIMTKLGFLYVWPWNFCRALHGLYLAWEQRLLFTVGTSMTTGRANCVTWNDIHLKTNNQAGQSHSYPDPHFLSNLMQVL